MSSSSLNMEVKQESAWPELEARGRRVSAFGLSLPAVKCVLMPFVRKRV